MNFLTSAQLHLNSIRGFQKQISALEVEDLLNEMFKGKRIHTIEIAALQECIEALWKSCYEMPEKYNLRRRV